MALVVDGSRDVLEDLGTGLLDTARPFVEDGEEDEGDCALPQAEAVDRETGVVYVLQVVLLLQVLDVRQHL